MGKVYNQAYKTEICKRVVEGGTVAREVGISENTIYTWASRLYNMELTGAEANLYAYCYVNPVNYSDYTGNMAFYYGVNASA